MKLSFAVLVVSVGFKLDFCLGIALMSQSAIGSFAGGRQDVARGFL